MSTIKKSELRQIIKEVIEDFDTRKRFGKTTPRKAPVDSSTYDFMVGAKYSFVTRSSERDLNDSIAYGIIEDINFIVTDAQTAKKTLTTADLRTKLPNVTIINPEALVSDLNKYLKSRPIDVPEDDPMGDPADWSPLDVETVPPGYKTPIVSAIILGPEGFKISERTEFIFGRLYKTLNSIVFYGDSTEVRKFSNPLGKMMKVMGITENPKVKYLQK